jgi:hypothetical protein
VFLSVLCICLFCIVIVASSILDIQKVLDGEVEIEAMDSHNNWCVTSPPSQIKSCSLNQFASRVTPKIFAVKCRVAGGKRQPYALQLTPPSSFSTLWGGMSREMR